MSDHVDSDENSSDSSYTKVDFYEGEYVYGVGSTPSLYQCFSALFYDDTLI